LLISKNQPLLVGVLEGDFGVSFLFLLLLLLRARSLFWSMSSWLLRLELIIF